MTSTNNLLSTIEINPSMSPIGTVILLHGLGADGNDFAPIVPELHLPSSKPLRFVFPNAPLKAVTINNGYIMPAWYDITSMDIHQRVDMNGMTESIDELKKLIARENERGIPSEKIILAGFSQGAVIALMTGLAFPHKLAGIMALSGYLPTSKPEIHPANQTTPIFVAHGTQDPIIPYTIGLESCDTLNRLGLATSWHSYQMAHSVNEKEIRDMADWLTKIFS